MQTLQVGQRWTYRTREGEETSTALILALDEGPEGQIVGVKLDGLRLPNPQNPAAFSQEVGHVPVTEQSFRASVLEVIETLPEASDLEGYEQWKAAYERHEAGVFALPLAEVVDALEEMLRPQQPLNDWGKANS